MESLFVAVVVAQFMPCLIKSYNTQRQILSFCFTQPLHSVKLCYHVTWCHFKLPQRLWPRGPTFLSLTVFHSLAGKFDYNYGFSLHMIVYSAANPKMPFPRKTRKNVMMMCIYTGFRFSSISNTTPSPSLVLQIGLLLMKLTVLWSCFLGLFRSSM